jgi:hypothetical protein
VLAEDTHAGYGYFPDDVCELRHRPADDGPDTNPPGIETAGNSIAPVRFERTSVTARRSLWAGYCVTFVLAAPPLAIEESWRGHPMIDSGTPIWIPFAIWAAAAFVLGAGLVADTRRNASLGRGLLLGIVMTVVLVACDLFRRFTVVGEGISFAVIRLLVIASLGAIGLSGLSGYVSSTLIQRRVRQGT